MASLANVEAVGIYRRNLRVTEGLMPRPDDDWLQLAAGDGDGGGDGDEDYRVASEVSRLSRKAAQMTGRRGSGHVLSGPNKCPPGCPRDHGVSAKGGVPHRDVERYHGASGDHRGDAHAEAPRGSNLRHGRSGPVAAMTTLQLSRPEPSTPDEIWGASEADDIALRHASLGIFR